MAYTRCRLEDYGNSVANLHETMLALTTARFTLFEVPDWMAIDTELLALSHAVLMKQCQLRLGYPVAISAATTGSSSDGRPSCWPWRITGTRATAASP